MELKIESILNFLRDENYDFYFDGNKDDTIGGFSTLFNYKVNTMTFVSSLNKFGDYAQLFREDKEIALIIIDPSEKIHGCFKNVIQLKNPKNVFFKVLDKFFGESTDDNNIISSNSDIYKKFSYVSDKATIGENVKIGVGCVIEGDVCIGDNTVIHHNVVIRNKTRIGNNCTILSGTVIGESGFNPLKSEDGSRMMIKHYGGVTIEENVHIGDKCSISRGAIDDTIIRSGVKINKNVIIAHNVVIGKNTIFTAPTFVCGSVKVGEKCHVAANVIRNQCIVGNGATLGLGSVVVDNVLAGVTVVGNPAKPIIKK